MELMQRFTRVPLDEIIFDDSVETYMGQEEFQQWLTRVEGSVTSMQTSLVDLKTSDAEQRAQLTEIKTSMDRHRAWHLAVESAVFAALMSAVTYLFGAKLGWW